MGGSKARVRHRLDASTLVRPERDATGRFSSQARQRKQHMRQASRGWRAVVVGRRGLVIAGGAAVVIAAGAVAFATTSGGGDSSPSAAASVPPTSVGGIPVAGTGDTWTVTATVQSVSGRSHIQTWTDGAGLQFVTFGVYPTKPGAAATVTLTCSDSKCTAFPEEHVALLPMLGLDISDPSNFTGTASGAEVVRCKGGILYPRPAYTSTLTKVDDNTYTGTVTIQPIDFVKHCGPGHPATYHDHGLVVQRTITRTTN